MSAVCSGMTRAGLERFAVELTALAAPDACFAIRLAMPPLPPAPLLPQPTTRPEMEEEEEGRPGSLLRASTPAALAPCRSPALRDTGLAAAIAAFPPLAPPPALLLLFA
jgi:hypothetical protein